MKKNILLSVIISFTALILQAQHHITYDGNNGSGGLSEYGIYTLANTGQATLGAEGNGDIFANLNLGSNISGIRRFWHISKRKSTSSHNLEYYFFDGTSFNNTLYTFSTNGNLGIGTAYPSNKLEVKSTSSGTNPALESENDLNVSSYFYTGRSGNTGIVNKTVIENASGNQILLNPSGGNTGIGIIDPKARLHIQHNGSSGSGGLVDYGVLAQANSGQATIGAEGTGDIFANLNLGTNISGTRRFWHISKRKSTDNHSLQFYHFDGSSFNNALFTFSATGNLGIGVTNPNEKLVVDGKIRSEEVKVEIINGPDYVFESDYDLLTLQETKDYITENKHLPEIPSANEMETNGIDLGEMNMQLLKKIEELTLHLIEQNERVEKLEKEVSTLKNK